MSYKLVMKVSLSLIYTSFKFLDVSQINLQLEEAFRLKRKHPGLIAGFDLVAEEDRGHIIDFYQKSWKKHDSLQRVTNLKLPYFDNSLPKVPYRSEGVLWTRHPFGKDTFVRRTPLDLWDDSWD